MPRFVLLYHRCPPHYVRASHWDLMLEAGDVLRTWALERLPCAWRDVHARTVAIEVDCPALAETDRVVAERLGDHRRDYLELEGPLSGNRGEVVRVAEGTYRTESEREDYCRITLAGEQLSSCVTLTRMSPDGSKWSLEFESAS